MLQAQLVRLEGIDTPCILLSSQGEVPEQLVIDFSRSDHPLLPSKGPTTYRLEPSSSQEPEPVYRELFDE